MILGDTDPHIALPWFWSTQGPIRLQITGLARPRDTSVVSGDPAAGRFSVFRYRADRLVAVESINRPADHVAARHVLAGDDLPNPLQVANPEFTIKQHTNRLATAN